MGDAKFLVILLLKKPRFEGYMKLFFQSFLKYLKEIFGESQRYIFTVFDVVGIILLFFPRLAQGLIDDEVLARTIGGLIFFASFSLANFNLYRKLSAMLATSLSESSIFLYPYEKKPYNNVEIRHMGTEPVKDLEIWLNYISKDNQPKSMQVEQFFPQNDPDMIWKPFKAHVFTEGEIIRFHLLQRKNTADRKVTVNLKCVGVNSQKPLEISKKFELKR
jgi:hypothetical protein